MSARVLALLLLWAVSARLDAQDAKKKPASLEFPGKSSASDGTAEAAKKVIDANAARLDAAKRLQEQRSSGSTAIIGALPKTGVTPKTEIEFPSAWRQVVENRAKLALARLTKKEAELLKALDTPLTVDFNKTRFREVIEFLADKSGYPIVVDKDALLEVKASYDDPVSYKTTKPLPMRALLRKVVRDVGLTYVLKDEVLTVVTPDQAREMLTVKAYPAEIIVTDLKYHNNKALKFLHAQHLIRIIQTMIEPLSWDVNGGPGSIVYDGPTEAFIVRASAEIHLLMRVNGFGR